MRPQRPHQQGNAVVRDCRSVWLGVPAPTGRHLADWADRGERMAAAALAAEGAPVVSPFAPSASLPARFDLRDVNGCDYLTPVRDQGRCAASVAFATVAVMESTAAYTRSASGLKLDLSEAHLHHVHAKARGCTRVSGTWPLDVFADSTTKGVTFEDCLPYRDNGAGPLAEDWSDRLARAGGVTDLTGDPLAMKRHIYGFGPVTACFVVHEDFFDYRGGVYRRAAGRIIGGHCVALVGWDDAAGCWIARNSWGAGWGEEGYFRIAYGDCHIEDYPGGRPSVLGCTSVNLRAWLPAQRALRLFTTSNDAEPWTYLENLGWAHLGSGPGNASRELAELARATATGRAVVPFVNGNELSTIRVTD